MHSEAFPRIKRGKFMQVARITQERFDYPRAVGFIDGKHIHIKNPARSGSIFYNYQHYYSTILLALCDCDHRIITYDVGAPGRASDTGVFRDSALKRFLDRHDDVLPFTTELGNVKTVQYHIFVNGGFGQGHRQDSLEAVQRFEPAPNAAYYLLEREEPESGTESAYTARERLTQYYTNKNGPARS
ncbi:unnamed protein product [Cylicocyclus nassatus]|uniref:DDE Tnp4 domain-containing protein n=1 Tax=Cylicocyclus nassatus TaxID=53992 RepID=A0AA36M5N0_CYLNA|nr:unnamed protein product [Cylicocyclus nassatus]